ncbi:MAG TPA: TonB family protein [Burkholderiales bacterium]|nr:TonB family protein [Burkholderiales bacterium]
MPRQGGGGRRRGSRAAGWWAGCLAVALLAALAPAAGAALDPAETARVLAGLEPAPRGLSELARPLIRPYARAVSERWQEYQRRIGGPMRAWALAELADSTGETVFYPSSGPDFPTVQQLYPNAARFVLVADQRADPPPALDRYSPQELSAFLAMFRAGWERFARLGFFRTKDLDADASLPGIRVGVTGPLMAFAARAGYDVVAVDPVRLNADGSDLEPAPGIRANRGTWESVRITLARDGHVVVLDYVRMDLSNAYLARHRASRGWLEDASANRTVLKSASHLPQRPQFSIVRDAIVARAPAIWQDETGIEYDTLARTHAVALYGRFTRPHRLFSPDAQRSLAAAYERQRGRTRPLGFRVGYEKESGPSVQVAVRRTPALAEAAAGQSPAPISVATLERQILALKAQLDERLKRSAAWPRRVFVGGRTADAPYADYVQSVRSRIVATARDAPARAGSLALVSVFIGADGVLQDVEIDRASGSPAFDRRVRAAARDAAPFPPLPQPVRDRADVLVITFQFPDT